MTAYNKISIYLLAFLMSFGFIGCNKGELVEEQEQLARITFRTYTGEHLNIKKISINGEFTRPDGTSFLFFVDKKDSADVVAFDDKDNKLIQQRLALKRGSNVFGVYPKSPLDPTLVVGKNPLETGVAPEGTYQVKILNYNKIISPNGEPIRLAIYKGTMVFDEVSGWEQIFFEEEPLVTTDLITDQIPEYFIQIPRTTFYKATVLDKDGNPLLLDGQNVYIYPRLGVLQDFKFAIMYLPNKEADVIFEEDWFNMVDGLGFELFDVWLKK
ncbi:hypothetical protein [Gynurincola endophyticus]|uniref:hypothetical protein n=1 Tax=Gynurincola endophyticus TaxID=2479004 RepID=UPI000F8EE8EF|nr:hypothetical protein [Gynurincola endophyticus]